MGPFSKLARLFQGLGAYGSPPLVTPDAWNPVPQSTQYEILGAYYGSNGLYDLLQRSLREQGVRSEALKPLRNPTFRVVEFYAAKLWPGELPDALPIETENDRIIPAIHQLWEWSNWSTRKQVGARWLAIYGDLFIKVATRRREGQPESQRRVFLQVIKPQYVTDFETDERGFLTLIRLDFPQYEEVDGVTVAKTYTELWDKTRFRSWLHPFGVDAPIDRLGTPVEDRSLAKDFSIDFVPFVHIKFRDTGDDRGAAAIVNAIDKIDEANRQATRLHQMLFRYNKAIWALAANAEDPQGRPLPPPTINSTAPGQPVDIGDDDMVRLPGMATLSPLVPAIDYDAALKILQDMMAELEKDLPELIKDRLRDMNEVSGVAVRTLMSDAIDRAREVRGNAEAGLVRAHQMALTIGANMRLPNFTELGGTYESGAFNHRFGERDIIPLSASEQAATDRVIAETIAAKQDIGISRKQALRELGYSDEEIEQMATDREDEEPEAVGSAILRGFDRGQGAA